MNPVRHMTRYFVLPIDMQCIVDPRQFKIRANALAKGCTTYVEIVRIQSIDGKNFLDLNLRRIDYIKENILPLFINRETMKINFGKGEKIIDPLIKCDIYRMPWTIQNKTLPKEVVKTEEGLKLVLRWMFDVAGNDDKLLFTITQIFNQRIGIDLFLFVFNTINDREPDRYLPSENTEKRNYSLYKKNGNVYIHSQIFGTVRDLNYEGKTLPVEFTAICRYNLITDQAIQIIRFRSLTK